MALTQEQQDKVNEAWAGVGAETKFNVVEKTGKGGTTVPVGEINLEAFSAAEPNVLFSYAFTAMKNEALANYKAKREAGQEAGIQAEFDALANGICAVVKGITPTFRTPGSGPVNRRTAKQKLLDDIAEKTAGLSQKEVLAYLKSIGALKDAA